MRAWKVFMGGFLPCQKVNCLPQLRQPGTAAQGPPPVGALERLSGQLPLAAAVEAQDGAGKVQRDRKGERPQHPWRSPSGPRRLLPLNFGHLSDSADLRGTNETQLRGVGRVAPGSVPVPRGAGAVLHETRLPGGRMAGDRRVAGPKRPDDSALPGLSPRRWGGGGRPPQEGPGKFCPVRPEESVRSRSEASFKGS